MSNGENFGGIVTTIQGINATYMTPKAYPQNFAGIIKALDDLSKNISSSSDTNLSYDSSSRVISSSTGTNATLTLAVASGDDGLLTGADKTQLNNLTSNLSGKANLINGKLVSSELPDIAISEFKGTVANQTAMLAIAGQEGDWVIRSDEGKVYLITGSDPTQSSSWTSLSYPASDVQSVNGSTGVVILNADNISDASTTNKFTTASEKTKLAGIETGAQVNVAADWNSTSGSSQVLNKPLLYNDSSVDTHLNTTSASNNELLSWTGSDYAWVTQTGGNTVDSVNTQTGVVVLDADDISDTSTTKKFTTAGDITKLAGIETGAEVNVPSNLSYTASTRTVSISTGTDIVLTEVVAAGDSGLITGIDKTKLDGIESGATTDQTAAEILTAVKTVDGAGSGLNADKLDDQEGSYYLDYTNLSNAPTIPSNNNELINGAGFITSTLTTEEVQDIAGGMVSGNTQTGITVTYQDSDGTIDFAVASQTDNNFTTTLKNKLDGIESGATTDQTAAQIKTEYESNGDTNVFTDAEKTKLTGIATGAEVNVQANFNETDASSDSFIQNKPTIPAAYTDSDVDSHLNTSTASNGEVLSWTGSDYDWIAQSGGSGNTNLSYTDSTRVIASSTGTDATLPLMSDSDAGLVPASGGGTTNFLRADGTFAAPAVGGAVDSVNTQTGVVVLDADDISDTSTTKKFTTAGDITKLAGIETGAEVNVQANFNETDASSDSFIQNKPTIPAAYTDSDVDTHLNTSTASNGEVLSWTGTDYDWVVQSGGSGNTDLSYTASTRVIASSTGTDATLPLMSTGDAGLVPASGGGTTNFLRADGTFAAPSGGGGSGTPLRYLHVDGSGSQALTTALATVDFDTTIATSDAADFTVGAGGEITVINAGTYNIEYSLDGDQSAGNNRVIVTGVVQVNGTTVTGSECSVYSRNTADGDFTAVGSCIAVLTANAVVRVQAQMDNSGITTSLELGTSALSLFSLSGSGPAGDAGPAGPSDIPQNSQTSAYTLVAGDNGKHINTTTGGVTVPSGVFSAGNVVSIFNDSTSDQTITQGSSVTLRLAGSATTGNRTLAQYGLATVLCVGSNEFVISGAGLS